MAKRYMQQTAPEYRKGLRTRKENYMALFTSGNVGYKIAVVSNRLIAKKVMYAQATQNFLMST
jgi:hypothetical protein